MTPEKLAARAHEVGINAEAFAEIIYDLTGKTRVEELTPDELDKVLTEVEDIAELAWET